MIPTYGPPGLVAAAARSIRATTRRGRVADHRLRRRQRARARRRLRAASAASSSSRGEHQAGFAANVNRGLRLVRPDEDAVVLNSDVIAHRGWLEALQFCGLPRPDAGIVGPKLLYPDGTIQSAGSIRNPARPSGSTTSTASSPPTIRRRTSRAFLAMTGAALYLTRAVLDRSGCSTRATGWPTRTSTTACARGRPGCSVHYCPYATLTHLESKTRGTEQGERELASQRRFWERWGAWFDDRAVRAPRTAGCGSST